MRSSPTVGDKFLSASRLSAVGTFLPLRYICGAGCFPVDFTQRIGAAVLLFFHFFLTYKTVARHIEI